MNNINFDAALKYIDLGSYDKAIEKLNTAIDEEYAKTNDDNAAKIRCVLGELYINLGKVDEAREEFNYVIEYSNENSILAEQRNIAKTYLDILDGKIKMPEDQPAKRPGYVPLVPKPVQDKGFISRQMNKKHK